MIYLCVRIINIKEEQIMSISKFIKYSAAIVFTAFLSACTTTDINAVSAEEFAQIVESKECLVIDVRTAAEFNSGHIKDVATVDFNSAEFEHKFKFMDTNMCIALYCRSGNRSGQALNLLKNDLGFKNIVHLDGGVKAWTAAGYELVKE